jgi:hypothetical protein
LGFWGEATLARTTNSTDSFSTVGWICPSNNESNLKTARRPSSTNGCRTVVKGGSK